ncbi:MAG TPA: AAA family ATPase [Polyangium sp.]|nr:AAA family ATPase [Polyangium sp.]
MRLTRAQTSSFLKALTPGPLAGTDERLYVPLDDVRGDDGFTSTESLWTTLLSVDEACLLFTGFPGSGKSTELNKLKERLERTVETSTERRDDDDVLPTHVVYVEGEEFFDVFNPVGIADVLRVIAYELDREATRAEGDDPEKAPSFVTRMVEFLRTTKIELLVKHDFGQYLGGGVNLMLELKNSPNFRQAAEEAIGQRGQAFLDLARQSMKDSIRRIRAATKNPDERVVVIVDGLDKIQPLQERDRESIEKSVELLFWKQASQLRIPCHVIYTFPLWLKYRHDVANAYNASPLILPMVKVHNKERQVHEPGIEALVEVVRRRIDIDAVFGAEADASLRDLIRASGGYLRDLMRLVRDVVLYGQDFPVTNTFVHKIIAKAEQDYAHTLYGTELDVLAEVAITHKPPQDTEGRMATFSKLYERRLILAYRNGEEWYDVHPMIREESRLRARLASP